MKMTTFQMIVLAVFGLCVIGGVASFALLGSSARNSGIGTVTIWGTVDGQQMETLLGNLRHTDKRFQNVAYVQKDPATYTSVLVNAMASGNSPDLFLVTQDNISSFSDKIATIPYASISQASFLSSYIDEGQLFVTPQGIQALPFMIDPLVMYWNKDLFATAGIARPPSYWNEFLSLAPKITSIDASANVAKSAVALGEWQNITYAKSILSSLIMQAGDPIVQRTKDGNLVSVLGRSTDPNASNPASSALMFYTEFANPSKTTYSWNRSLPQSLNAFTAGNVAVYIGFASDYPGISTTNPNLNIGVGLLPQIQGNSTRLTFGNLSAFAVSRTAPNPKGALAVAELLSGALVQQLVIQQTGLPSVRRDVSLDTSSNAASYVFTQSALIARGWLDPSPATTDSVFQTMIESVLSGQQNPAGAVERAYEEMSHVISSPQ